jgi:hypothetical protein
MADHMTPRKPRPSHPLNTALEADALTVHVPRGESPGPYLNNEMLLLSIAVSLKRIADYMVSDDGMTITDLIAEYTLAMLPPTEDRTLNAGLEPLP